MFYYVNETVFTDEQEAVNAAIESLIDYVEEDEGEDLDIEVTSCDHGIIEVIGHYNIECMEMYAGWNHGEIVPREKYFWTEADKTIEIEVYEEEDE